MVGWKGTVDVVKDVVKKTDDVVKGKANVTKEFAKAQRQIYKLDFGASMEIKYRQACQ